MKSFAHPFFGGSSYVHHGTRTGRIQMQKPNNSNPGNTVKQSPFDGINENLNKAIDAQQKKALGTPSIIWRRANDGKFYYVKAYTLIEDAIAALPKLPGRKGEILVVLTGLNPTQSILDAIEPGSNTVRVLR